MTKPKIDSNKSVKTSKCAIKISRQDDCSVRLYVLHHAGGSHLLFRPWLSLLPDWVEVIALEVPGRGYSFGDQLCSGLEELISLFLREVRTDKPFAFFGHSMGALIAYEMTLQLIQMKAAPIWLGISAFLPPHLHNRESKSRSQMNDKELIQYLAKLGRMSTDEYGELEQDTLTAILEIVRSDFRLVDNWIMSEDSVSESTTFHCFSGKKDRLVTPTFAQGWDKYSPSKMAHTILDDGHFYVDSFSQEIVECMLNGLSNKSVTYL